MQDSSRPDSWDSTHRKSFDAAGLNTYDIRTNPLESAVPKTTLKKEKWTLSFEPRLKRVVIREARKRGMYPVGLLEQVVREKFGSYGYSEVEDSVSYVREMRKRSRRSSDEAFLEEIRGWQRSRS